MKEKIWFKSFTLQDTVEIEEEVDSIIWGKYKTKNTYRAYKNRSYLYKGVADFINQIGSENFVGVTGSPFGENQDGYMYGEVVVWYKMKMPE